MTKSFSSYYGPAPSANTHPQYSDAILRRDLEASSLDDATRTSIETELARREAARRERKGRRATLGRGEVKCHG